MTIVVEASRNASPAATDLHDQMAAAIRTLTPRELACLSGKAKGKSLKLIGNELGIEAGTVSSYLRDATRKLGARSPSHAAMLLADAQRRPLISGGSNQGIAPFDLDAPLVVTVEATTVTEVNDAALDCGPRGNPESFHWSRAIQEILSGARPDDLSMHARGLLIAGASVAIGMILFVACVGLALVAGPVEWVRSYFP